jgi:predicted PurR-regulated permease PerM
VPIALAVLLSFVLSPAVRLLQGKYFPRAAAVAVIGLLAFTAIFGLGTILATQVHDLAKDLPRYQTTLQAKIESLRGTAASTGTLERAARVLQDLKEEIDAPRETTPSLGEGASPAKPIPVEVKQPNPGALQTLAALITPLIQPLTTTGIVVIFVIRRMNRRLDLLAVTKQHGCKGYGNPDQDEGDHARVLGVGEMHLRRRYSGAVAHLERG